MGKIVHQSWCHIWHVAHECYGCSPVHDMTHSQMLGKFEYTGGPIFKVVLEC